MLWLSFATDCVRGYSVQGFGLAACYIGTASLYQAAVTAYWIIGNLTNILAAIVICSFQPNISDAIMKMARSTIPTANAVNAQRESSRLVRASRRLHTLTGVVLAGFGACT